MDAETQARTTYEGTADYQNAQRWLIAGFLAQLLMPGKAAGGILAMIVLGIVGAIVGGFLGTLLGFGDKLFVMCGEEQEALQTF
jgi:hypothetical protein